jgi:VWFA-related protein
MQKAILVFFLTLQLSLSGFSQQPVPLKPNPAPAQPESQQPGRTSDDDVVRITTNLVQVDPVITDGKGKQVTDLTPEEVEILEDGKPQKITNFSYVSLESRAPSPASPAKPLDKNAPPLPSVPLKPEQVRRTMALVVDDLGLSFESAHFVRQALKKFLDQQMQSDDLVAIIRTGGGIGALQQFTSDKRQLYAAVEKVKWTARGRGGIGAFAPLSAEPSITSPAEDGDSRESAGEDLDQFREDLFAVGTLGAVNNIVRGLRELPGRKSILLISDGIKILTRSDPTGSSRILTALRRLTDLANRASVVIYTMDARGLQTLGLTAADSTSGMSSDQIERSLSNRRSDFFESQNGLNYLAQQTGGFAIRNSNDLAGGIKRVIEDQRGYYLIGYRPEESTFDEVSGRRKFHKFGLRVKRPGKFNVRMRNGFYGITEEDRAGAPQTAAQRLVAALISPFGSAGVHVRLTSLFANDAKVGSIMRSMLHVKGSDLTFKAEPDGWHTAVFDILAVTFGDNGVIVDQIGRTHTIRLKGKTIERVLRGGFTYNLTVPVKKSGAYQLRTAVRDASSDRVGSASQFIEVPDIKKNRLTLSGIILRGVPRQSFEKSGVDLINDVQGSDDTSDEVEAGPAVRQFKPGLVMVYGFVVHNAQIDKPTGKPRVHTQVRLFRNGQLIFDGKEKPVDVTGQLDLKRLPVAGAALLGSEMVPGEYAFQVIVTDLLAKEKHRLASQWIDFEIVK